MPFILSLDQSIFQLIQPMQAAWLTPIMTFITNVISPVTLPIFALIIIGWLIYRKRIEKAIVVIIALGGGFALETILKILVARPRPPIGLITETDFSFPSGHATLSIIFFSLMIYLFKDKLKNKILKWSYVSTNVILCLLVGFSRLYLGVHWFSDVIGGYVIGLLWVILILVSGRKIKFKSV